MRDSRRHRKPTKLRPSEGGSMWSTPVGPPDDVIAMIRADESHLPQTGKTAPWLAEMGALPNPFRGAPIVVDEAQFQEHKV